jgi:hypothetical protein
VPGLSLKHLPRFGLSALAGAWLLLSAGVGHGQQQPSRWQGNGHFYEVVTVPGGITWVEAEAAARAKGGYLATPTTNQENRFLWTLIAGKPQFWTTSLRQGQADAVGPWIGLVQRRHHVQEPAGGWGWVSQEPMGQTNWAPGKPNNLEEIEDYGHYFVVAGSGDEATWNDYPNDARRLKAVTASRPVAYIIEYNSDPRR